MYLWSEFVYLKCREQLRPVLKHRKMKSRITIEVDFENGNLPVIQILRKDSDDVRDKLISSFLQSFQHTSRWIKIDYAGEFSQHGEDGDVQKWILKPVVPSDLPNEIKLMEALLSTAKKEISS